METITGLSPQTARYHTDHKQWKTGFCSLGRDSIEKHVCQLKYNVTRRAHTADGGSDWRLVGIFDAILTFLRLATCLCLRTRCLLISHSLHHTKVKSNAELCEQKIFGL